MVRIPSVMFLKSNVAEALGQGILACDIDSNETYSETKKILFHYKFLKYRVETLPQI